MALNWTEDAFTSGWRLPKNVGAVSGILVVLGLYGAIHYRLALNYPFLFWTIGVLFVVGVLLLYWDKRGWPPRLHGWTETLGALFAGPLVIAFLVFCEEIGLGPDPQPTQQTMPSSPAAPQS